MFNTKYYILLPLLLHFSSCKKFIERNSPQSTIVRETVFSSDATAFAALNGMYGEMMNNEGFISGNINSITFLSGRSSDEFWDYSSDMARASFFTNTLTPDNLTLKTSLWEAGYKFIYYANAIIEGLENSTTVGEPVKKQLTGEAKFVRAFCHFYLANMFGEVPVAVSTDYKKNSSATRQNLSTVYTLVIEDLHDASTLLRDDYSASNTERIRPCRFAALALLARVQLYNENWSAAEETSTAVINSGLYSLPNPDDVFLANSQEAVWQLKPVLEGRNTFEANYFILRGIPVEVSLNPGVVNRFETGDERRERWIGDTTIEGNTYHYPFKYKQGPEATSVTEYSMVLRFAEQYLIRAEARLQQDNISGAVSDLNIIRTRARGANPGDLPDLSAALSKAEVMQKLEDERLFELFSELGHRWFDIKRTGRANDVMVPVKGSSWQSTDILYPVPRSEISSNHNLTQNQGYE